MKTTMKNNTVIILFILTFFMTASAFANPEEQGGPQRRQHGPNHEQRILEISEELNLSDTQKEQIREKKYQEQKASIQIENSTRLKELDLRHELEKTNVDTDAISKIVSDLKELHGSRLQQRVNAILGLRQILTPEQFEKFQAMGKNRMKNRQGRQGQQPFQQQRMMKRQDQMQ
ncbi:MAG: periplasmic heavy metal sensor [Chlamydiota bacterium]|nr:periplasmic heavy metal sensor [Chlamydiota bacterium]